MLFKQEDAGQTAYPTLDVGPTGVSLGMHLSLSTTYPGIHSSWTSFQYFLGLVGGRWLRSLNVGRVAVGSASW